MNTVSEMMTVYEKTMKENSIRNCLQIEEIPHVI